MGKVSLPHPLGIPASIMGGKREPIPQAQIKEARGHYVTKRTLRAAQGSRTAEAAMQPDRGAIDRGTGALAAPYPW